MTDTLGWVYLANAVVLLVHEIDSAYWREWELFRLPGGINGFLALHFPLVALVLFGLVAVERRTAAGLAVSFALAVSGVFAFTIHTYFIRRGRPEFTSRISRAILWAALVLSLLQAALTVRALGASR